MLKLYVHVTLPDGTCIPCGEIVTDTPAFQGKIKGSFRYFESYLNNPDAFPLDPAHIPLAAREFAAQRPEGVHGVFEDALPDDWGRKLLIRKAELLRKDQTVPNLLKVLRNTGLGALSFVSERKYPPYRESSASILTLRSLVETAMKHDAGLPLDDTNLQKLFSCGSSPGGARPKALIRKESGSFWIAKFPRFSDSFNIETIEAGTLQIAQNAGLTIPEFEIQTFGNKKVLLVKRFDISDQGGRYHMISMQTLLKADGYYNLSYSHLFNAVQKYSNRPVHDIQSLFRQMVFNAAIGNTDDHLKNFCMLHTRYGFSLSPAYDLLPDVNQNREHQLSFPLGAGFLPPVRRILQTIGAAFNISLADEIVDDVYNAVADWQNIFRAYEVPDSDIKRLGPDIKQRMKLLQE